MTITGWIQILAVAVVLTGLTPLLGGYMASVYQGERVALTAILGPIERIAYRLLRADPSDEQGWRDYARSLLLFSAASWLILYIVLRTQGIQPLNPQGFTHSGPWDLSFNTASSFVSNTSWQYYAGETTLSDFAQMAGITVASFTSCATGMAVAAAVIRGLSRRGTDRLGNFWVDLVRSTLYVLIPLSILAALLLVATGVPQTISHYLQAHGPTGLAQTIAIGPVASQEAIKLMSGDGGGFFNTNSAHPFENPTGISNFVEILLMLLIPAAFTATFGQMIGRRRQGWALYVAMLVMFLAGTAVIYAAETHPTPAQHAAGLRHVVNLEGKEQRFGAAGSAVFVSAGTASGDGGVNSAVESFTGLGAAVAMSNMMTGEVIFGGPGSGLYGMIILVVLVVFIAGLMVGRTPEYLGKQIQAREVKLASLGALFVPLLVLAFVALAVTIPAGRPSMTAHGPQGFAETAYAYLSQAQNNGSAFAGYSGFIQPVAGNIGSHGIAFADIAGGWVMILGRFVPILFALALAGSLGPRRIAPPPDRGNAAHRHPDVRHPPDRLRRDLRRPHLPDDPVHRAVRRRPQLPPAQLTPVRSEPASHKPWRKAFFGLPESRSPQMGSHIEL
jgi:K+-transporting ATPase ATPase A chain